jgi:hypothetical protein
MKNILNTKPTESGKYHTTSNSTVLFETPNTHSHFFGYYDKSPFDADGNRLLSLRVDFDRREVRSDDEATVGYWRIDEETFVEVGTTQAFNWQQGAMLQWLPPSYNQKIVYNDRCDGRFCAEIVNIKTGERRTLDSPVYAIHPSGESALTVNFERMRFCRPGYSYRGIKNEKWNVPCHEADGIFKTDIQTGAKECIVDTSEICNIDWRPEFDSHDSWLEHPLWNPSGTRFAFLHRWNDPDGSFRSRLFTANPDGSDLFMFPDTGVYSHMDWRNNEELTVWTIKPSPHEEAENFIRDNQFLDSVVRPTYRFLKNHVFGSWLDQTVLPSRGYIEFTDKNCEPNMIGSDRLTEDGHFTWSRDEHWLLTDTYPLQDDYKYLLLYNSRSDNLHELGHFRSTMADTPFKCDLHPRWDREENRIAVDSDHGQTRQMVVLEQEIR